MSIKGEFGMSQCNFTQDVRPKDMEEMKEWLSGQTVKVDYQSLNTSHWKRLSINHTGTNFEVFFLPSTCKKLYVMLTTPGYFNTRYPVFTRNSWSFVFNNSMFLCIDDPTRVEINYPVCFFFGTKNKSYLKCIIDIVLKFAEIYNINNEDICFIGSSVSGYAAIYCTNYITGSKCIALDPQVSIKDWVKTLKNYGCECFEKTFNVKFSENDHYNRFNLSYILKNNKSKFFIYYNILSKEDNMQITNLFKDSNYVWNEGLQRFGNIWLLVTKIEAVSPHAAIPNEFFCKIIEGFMNRDPTQYDKNICEAILSWMNKFYLSEKNFAINERKMLRQEKRLFYIEFWKKFLSIHKHAIPFFLDTSNNIEGVAIQFFINGINNTIHYEITFPKNEKMGIALHFEGEDGIESINLNNLISKIIMKLKDKGFEEKKWNNNISIRATINENDFDFMFNKLVRESFFDILLYKKNNFYEEFYFIKEFSDKFINIYNNINYNKR